MWWWDPLMISQPPARFGGRSHRRSGDKMDLVCHKISQDYVTKGLNVIMSKNPLRLVTILLSLVAIDTVVVEICFSLSWDFEVMTSPAPV